jgi:HK97 family phage portal protein
MQGHKDTAGNAYAWIERDKRGYPVALWPREPDWYRPEIVGGLLKYRYRLNGKIEYDDPQNVFHLKHLTRDGLVGMSPVEYFREGISLGLGYQSHAANTFRNAARPSLVASTPNVNLSPDKAKEIGKSLTDQYAGTSNAGKILVAYGGMELKPWGFSNKDAEYIESMRLSNEDACRIWRVPPYKVMDYTQSAYANMATASQEYVNDSLRPDQIMWEQEIAAKLLGQRDRSVYYAEHNNEELLKGTPLERAQVENMRLMNGTSSIDEVRRSHNWKPVAGGDKHRTQMQMVPIDAVVEDQSEDTEPQPEPQARTVRKNVIRDERGNITAIEEVVI